MADEEKKVSPGAEAEGAEKASAEGGFPPFPADFDWSKLPPPPADFDWSKMPPPPADFDPSKFKDFDFSKMPPPPSMEEMTSGEDEPLEEDILKQKEPAYWLKHAPRTIRGNMKRAFKLGAQGEKMECTCWNRRCPYFGNCRKCIVFHMALKQVPTCQRDMLRELMREGVLASDLYLDVDP